MQTDDESDLPLTDLINWIEEEIGGKVVAIMPSGVEIEPIGESYWVIFEDNGKRSIHWIVGIKSYSEGSGPAAVDCPLAFLDLAPVENEEWRKQCIEYHARMKTNVIPLRP